MGGTGVGAATAAKLLQRYGTLEGVMEAGRQGQLKGWGPGVQGLLSGGPQHEQHLRQRRQLFSMHSDPAILREEERQQLRAALAGLSVAAAWDAAGSGAAADGAQAHAAGPAELAWLHPLMAGRWRYIKEPLLRLSAALDAVGMCHTAQAATSSGLAADLLLAPGGSSAAVAVFLVGRGDLSHAAPLAQLQAAAPPPGAAGEAARALGDAGQVAALNRLLLPQLNGACKHHVGLLRKAGLAVASVPWWHLG